MHPSLSQPSEYPGSTPDTPSFLWLVPVLLALVVNMNVLQNGFVWDDKIMLEQKLITDEEKQSLYLSGSGSIYYRPVITVITAIEWSFFGKNPLGYHMILWLAHALVTFLVYFCIRRLNANSRYGSHLALLCASLFAVHPIHSEAVAWIFGLHDVSMTLFLLIGVLGFLFYLSGNRLLWTGPMAGIGFTLSILCKETALAFAPLFLILHALIKGRRLLSFQTLKNPFSWIFIIIILMYGLTRLISRGGIRQGITWSWTSLGSVIETITLTYGTYLRLFLFPYPLNAFVNEFPDSGADYFSLVFLGVLFFIGLGLVTIYRRSINLTIGAWWVFLGLLLPALVPFSDNIPTVASERYGYLPSIGFLLIASHLILQAWSRIHLMLSQHHPVARFLTVGPLILLIGILSLLSASRNQVWLDSFTLWNDTAQKSPGAAKPQVELGGHYESQGNLQVAKSHYRRALQNHGSSAVHSKAANSLAYLLIFDRELDEAERVIKTALKSTPRHPVLRYTAGYIYWEKALSLGGGSSSKPYLERARYQLGQAVSIDPNLAGGHYLLALVCLRLNNRSEARHHFQKVLEIAPDSEYGRFSEQAIRGLMP